MNKKNLLFLAIVILSTTSLTAQTTQHHYDYDGNGNRIARNTVLLPLAPPPGGGGNKTENTVAIPTQEDITLLAYPNPTAQHVEITASESLIVTEARLYNVQGKVLQQMQNMALPMQVELGHLPAGNYIIWLQLPSGNIERVRVVRR